MKPALILARHFWALAASCTPPPPLNLTLSLTHRCNLHCVFCNIPGRATPDLPLEFYRSLAESLGPSAIWITFSGGEPFLRMDLEAVVTAFSDTGAPRVLNIPTNGTIPGTAARAKRIAARCPSVSVVINLSIDDLRERHDRIRGQKGVFERAVSTLEDLLRNRPPNLKVGVHSVVSAFNAGRMKEIAQMVRFFHPDHYLTEVAEERWEMQNQPLNCRIGFQEYAQALSSLERDLDKHAGSGFSLLSSVLRKSYYRMTLAHLKSGKRMLPCRAGRLSAHVDADGTVWACCVKGQVMGRLGPNDTDFMNVWRSRRADAVRNEIQRGNCSCPLANAAYSSMLMSIPHLLRAGRAWIRLGSRQL